MPKSPKKAKENHQKHEFYPKKYFYYSDGQSKCREECEENYYLDKYNICVRAGNHCAKILKDDLGIKNTCRISLYFYNTKEEIDLLINVLRNSKNIIGEL